MAEATMGRGSENAVGGALVGHGLMMAAITIAYLGIFGTEVIENPSMLAHPPPPFVIYVVGIVLLGISAVVCCQRSISARPGTTRRPTESVPIDAFTARSAPAAPGALPSSVPGQTVAKPLGHSGLAIASATLGAVAAIDLFLMLKHPLMALSNALSGGVRFTFLTACAGFFLGLADLSRPRQRHGLAVFGVLASGLVSAGFVLAVIIA